MQFPHRVEAVASLCTPLPRFSDVPFMEQPQQSEEPDPWQYQRYFAKPGAAEAEFAADPGHTIRALIRAPDEYVKGANTR